ncbi:MAG TPA: hypothetical protein VI756_02655, partial [Blastocatellia bacterium]
GSGASQWIPPNATLVEGWLGFVPIPTSGGAFSGPVYLAADPTSALQPVTKEYSDAHSGLTLFDGRTGAITLLAADIATALGYTPQTPLTFVGMIQDNANVVSCPTCQNTGAKDVALGYAGLNASGLVPNSLIAQVLAVTDLTTYNALSGNGTVALGSTITSPVIGQVLTWNGSAWINQTAPGASGSGYETIALAGVGLTQQNTLNFIGNAISIVNNSGASRTDFTLNQTPSGSTSVVGSGRQVIAGTGLSGGGALTADVTLNMVAGQWLKS